MAFDPNKPVENSPLDADEMRAQLNGLKALMDAQQMLLNDFQAPLDALPANDGMTDRITDLSARNVDAIPTLTLSISNPPTQSQVQAILAKLNEALGGLHH